MKVSSSSSCQRHEPAVACPLGHEAPALPRFGYWIRTSRDQSKGAALRTVPFFPGGRAGPPDPPRAPLDAPRRPDRPRALACVASRLLLFPLGPPAACLAVLALQDLRVPSRGRTGTFRCVPTFGRGLP